MEYELMNHTTKCCVCGSPNQITVKVNFDNTWLGQCEKCLTRALLLIRPIQFDKLNVLDSLDYLKRTADNGDKDLLRFIDWLKPFLEARK